MLGEHGVSLSIHSCQDVPLLWVVGFDCSGRFVVISAGSAGSGGFLVDIRPQRKKDVH